MKKNDLTEFLNVEKELKIASKMCVRVGVIDNDNKYPSGEKVYDVGMIHEYGLGNPRRSFIRMPLDYKSENIVKQIKKGFDIILTGNGYAKVELAKVGVVGQNICRDSFKFQGWGQWQPLSPKTIKAKGSSKILLDTGTLVSSISYKVDRC